MAYSAGTAYLTVIPSFKNVERALWKEAQRIGKMVETAVAKAVPEGMAEAHREAATEGARAGEAYAGAFAAKVHRGAAEALKGFEKVTIDVDVEADIDPLKTAVAEVIQDLETLRNVKLGVDFEVDEDELFNEIDKIKHKAEQIERDAVTVEVRSNARKVIAEMEALQRLRSDDNEARERARGTADGAAYGGAFVEAAGRRLPAAMRAIGEQFDVDFDLEGAEGDLARLREEMAILSEKKIDVDIPASLYLADLRQLKEALDEVANRDISPALKHNARAASAEIDALIKQIDPPADDEAAKGAKDGTVYGGAFGAAAAKGIKAGLAAIGEVELKADASPAEREVAELRAELVTLGEYKVGVDIDAAALFAKIQTIQARLRALAAQGVKIDVQTNLLSAANELNTVEETFDRLTERAAKEGAKFGTSFATAAKRAIDGALEAVDDLDLDVDTNDAHREIAELREQLRTLSSLEIGVDIDAAQAYAVATSIQARLRALAAEDVDIEVRSNLLSAAAQLKAVDDMIDRLDGRNVKVKVDTRSFQQMAQDAGISMSRLGMLISLGASIGTAIVPAAAVAAASISAIATAASAAVLGVGVLGLGLFSVVQAVTALHKFQLDSRKSGVALAASQDRVANALDTVTNAQQALVRAERDRKQAVEDLAEAQERARRQLEDMALAVKENSLAQRQARLDEIEAKRELDAILANPRATEEEREQARITYEQRVLQIEELGLRQKRLADDKAEADRKGVSGSDLVLAAQERIVNATEAVASAQRSLASSQRALAQAYDKTGVAGGAALENLQDAMDALSPAGRRFALFIFGLKDDFKGLQHAAEEGLLPGLQRGIESLLPFLPQIESLVGKVGTALGEIFVEFAESLKDPTWQAFFGYISDTAVPALKGMFTFASNIAKGFAGIILGLSGFNGSIGDGLLKWSEGFAEWATTLETNEGWQKFLAYVREAAPVVIDMFRNIWDFTKKFVAAAAPIGLFVVEAFKTLFGWLDKIDTDTWTIIIAGIAGVGAALLVVSAVTAAIGTGIAGAIIAAVAAVGVGLALMYKHIEPFRKAVDATISAIGSAAMWLWETGIRPTFANIRTAVGAVVEVFATLYESVFKNIFAAIGAIVVGWWNLMRTVFDQIRPVWSGFATLFGIVFQNFRNGVSSLGAILTWVWEHVFKPVFERIGVVFQVWKAIFSVVFGLFQIGVKIIGAAWRWFYDKAIKPVIDLLRPAFTWLAEVIAKHVEPPFRKGLEALGKAWDWLVDASKKPIKFMIETVLNNGLLAGYNKIAKFFDVKPDNVKIDLPKGFAVGGAVRGPGTPTSDSILARLSNDEHVWTAREVRALGGHDAMYSLRRAVLDGTLPGFARGGPIGGRGDGLGDLLSGLKKKATDAFTGVKDFFSDPMGSLKRLAAKLYDLVPGKDSTAVKVLLGMPQRAVKALVDKVKNLFASSEDGSGVTGGGLGWQRQMQILRGQFPGLALNSGFRPGAVTISGNKSWHSVGRAVDVPPRRDVFEWIAANFPNSRELIFSPMGNRQIRNGKPWTYSGAVRDTHWDHVHWAFDSGGWMQPGQGSYFNGTGRPEAVLTSQQWGDISALARGGDGAAARAYHFTFRDTTLDPGKLRAMQDRDEALSRQGRAR